MHVQEPDDLIGCNAAPESLSARVSRDHTHTEIRKPENNILKTERRALYVVPVQDFCEKAQQCNLKI